MNPENAIEVRDVVKYFKVYQDKGHLLRDRLLHISRNKYERREVLRGISFDVKKGEAVGLIGKNGCGKSTTLKMLTRILRPNNGTITSTGRVYSLIELGAGFHPDMTGRENIYINASIFGIKAKEVDQKLNDIIRFSELEEFIDNPVRTYSSGMYMRLAFSVAINVDADILLVDEILAVGDNAFQTKCFNKLKSLKDEGVTIVLVSHALGQVERLCDRAIWLEQGRIRAEGPARQICKQYLDAAEEARKERQQEEESERRIEEQAGIEQAVRELENAEHEDEEERKRKEQELQKRIAREQERLKNASCRKVCSYCAPEARREGSEEAVFTKVRFLNPEGKETTSFWTDEAMTVEMSYRAKQEGVPVDIAVGFTGDDWVYRYGTSIYWSERKFLVTQKEGTVRLTFPQMMLKGKYSVEIFMQDSSRNIFDRLAAFMNIELEERKIKGAGCVKIPHQWESAGKFVCQEYEQKAQR